jgi:hypothetical protein
VELNHARLFLRDGDHQRDRCFADAIDLKVLGAPATYAKLGSGFLEDGLGVRPFHANQHGHKVEVWGLPEQDVHPHPRRCTWPPLLPCCRGQTSIIGVIGISVIGIIVIRIIVASMIMTMQEFAAFGKAAGTSHPMLADGVCHPERSKALSKESLRGLCSMNALAAGRLSQLL